MNNISKLERRLDSRPARVLVVDDDAISAALFEHVLEQDFHITVAGTGQSALDLLTHQHFDLILLDMHLPDITGLEICKQLKASSVFKHIPIIFITGSQDQDIQLACWEAGCVDYIEKPIISATLFHRVRTHVELKLLNDKLRRLADRDGLTSVFNRRYLERYLDKETEYLNVCLRPMAIVMIDIDYFKRYNDSYGHLAGDDCLVAVAGALVEAMHDEDGIVARFGGEEFAIVLPNADTAKVTSLCQRLQDNISSLNIDHTTEMGNKLTISIGCAVVTQPIDTPNVAIDAADKQLYRAKAAGRNRYHITLI